MASIAQPTDNFDNDDNVDNNILVRCLKKADTDLHVAIAAAAVSDVEEEGKEATLEPAEATAHNTMSDEIDDDDDDDDDLAAAFFAQQAKKLQEENRLPLHEWARVLVQFPPPVNGFDDDMTTATTKKTSSTIPDEEAEKVAGEMFNEYQRIVQHWKVAD